MIYSLDTISLDIYHPFPWIEICFLSWPIFKIYLLKFQLYFLSFKKNNSKICHIYLHNFCHGVFYSTPYFCKKIWVKAKIEIIKLHVSSSFSFFYISVWLFRIYIGLGIYSM